MVLAHVSARENFEMLFFGSLSSLGLGIERSRFGLLDASWCLCPIRDKRKGKEERIANSKAAKAKDGCTSCRNIWDPFRKVRILCAALSLSSV